MSSVLLVTIQLTRRSGTEVVAGETARGLRERHHDVAIYTHACGRSGDALRAEGFEVVTDLAELTRRPDVIQANQSYPLLDAVGRFPDVPAISICHDATVWFSRPIDLPAIRRHVAVDLACRDRIVEQADQPADGIALLHNAVDLAAFRPRPRLPAAPARALVLVKHPNILEVVRSACAQRGIAVDALGAGIDREVDNLPAVLPAYDLVFASARGALEALASGCAVIVVDGRGLAGLVTAANVASWCENNFGLRLLHRPITTAALVADIDRYDASDAKLASDFIREASSLARYLDRLEQMHREVIAESKASPIDKDLLLGRLIPAERSLAREHEAHLAQVAGESESSLRAEFSADAHRREAEFHKAAATREAEFRAAAADREAQLHEAAARREDEFRSQFDAYRDWVAPRNVGRRVLRKARRMLTGD
jgi:hypothetical protein